VPKFDSGPVAIYVFGINGASDACDTRATNDASDRSGRSNTKNFFILEKANPS
jgi:hypothetical protein